MYTYYQTRWTEQMNFGYQLSATISNCFAIQHDEEEVEKEEHDMEEKE